MNIVTHIAAFALVLLGGDWLLTALGVLPTTSFSGQAQGGIDGAALVVAGLLLLIWTGRRADV
jgi:hypothetical protein